MKDVEHPALDLARKILEVTDVRCQGRIGVIQMKKLVDQKRGKSTLYDY